MYDFARDKGASDAESDCAVDKNDPDAGNDSRLWVRVSGYGGPHLQFLWSILSISFAKLA